MIRTVIRYLTSFFGAVSRTIGGLAVILALPVAVLSVTFLWPSFVGSLGVNQFFMGSVTQVVGDVKADTPLSTTVVLASLVGLVGIYLLGSRVGNRLYDIGQPTGDSADSTASETSAGPADYRRKLSNLSYLVGTFFGLVAAVTILEPTVIPLSLITGLGLGTIQFVFIGFAAGYAFAGYGARQGWTESVLVGSGLYLVNLLAGISNLNLLGVLIGGYGLYYTARGIGGTSFAFLDVDVPESATDLERRFRALHGQGPSSGPTEAGARTPQTADGGDSPESNDADPKPTETGR